MKGKHFAGGPVEQASKAYRHAREATGVESAFWLRWRYRHLTRRRDQLDGAGLVVLKAVTDELQCRGLELPEVKA
jgi:hypothetical protein